MSIIDLGVHFLRFLRFLGEDIWNALLLIIGLMLIIVVPFCLGALTGLWIEQNIWWWLPGWLSGPILGFCFIGVAFMTAAYLDTVWNKARPKKRKA